MGFKAYFDCRQCRERVPTPAPTPVPLSRNEQLYIDAKSGDATAIALASTAIVLLLFAVCIAGRFYCKVRNHAIDVALGTAKTISVVAGAATPEQKQNPLGLDQATLDVLNKTAKGVKTCQQCGIVLRK